MNINLVFREQSVIDKRKVESFRLVDKLVNVTEHDEMYSVNLDGNKYWKFGGMEVRTPAGEVIKEYPLKIEVDIITEIKVSKMAHEFLSCIFTETGAAPYILSFNEETLECERHYMLNENTFYHKKYEYGSLADIYRKNMDDCDHHGRRRSERTRTPYKDIRNPDPIDGLFGKVISLENTIPLPCYSQRYQFGTEVKLLYSHVKGRSELFIVDPANCEEISTGIWVAGKITASTNFGTFDITEAVAAGVGITSAVVRAIDDSESKNIEIFCITAETVSGKEDAN